MGQADKDALNEKIAEGEMREKKKKRKELKEKMKKEKTSFFADFKKFITKGNVLDMAVAVVVATAFNAIVTGLVKNIITPFVTYLTSGVSIDEWKWVLNPEMAGTDAEIAVNYGLWIQSIVDFLIIAFTVFVFVRVVTNMQKKMNWREEEKKAAEAAKKKEEEAKAAAAAAEKAAALAKREEEYYQNVKVQADLLKEIKDLLEKK